MKPYKLPSSAEPLPGTPERRDWEKMQSAAKRRIKKTIPQDPPKKEKP